MINKLTVTLSVVLCLAAFGGAAVRISAQTNGSDKILVAGKQPLRQSHIDSVIEFYEWAFETSFSDTERNRFQKLSVEDFRKSPATGYNNAEILIKTLSKVRSLDEDAQRTLRNSFNENFVKDLRASSDEGSQLLLGIYERGPQKAFKFSDVDPLEAPYPSNSNRGAGSSKLVGKWMRSTGAGGNTDGTGKTRYNSGTNTTFDFYADGKMLITIDKQTLSITQCGTSELTKLPGTYSIEGGQLIMNLGTGIAVGKNSCDRAGNFNKTLTPSVLKKTFVVRKMESVFRPDEPLLLCLDGSTKDDDCFERDPKF